MNKEGSCFPESQNVLANIAFPFKGVLEQNQETQRPAGFTLQRGGEKRRNSPEREEPSTNKEKGEFLVLQIRKKRWSN